MSRFWLPNLKVLLPWSEHVGGMRNVSFKSTNIYHVCFLSLFAFISRISLTLEELSPHGYPTPRETFSPATVPFSISQPIAQGPATILPWFLSLWVMIHLHMGLGTKRLHGPHVPELLKLHKAATPSALPAKLIHSFPALTHSTSSFLSPHTPGLSHASPTLD